MVEKNLLSFPNVALFRLFSVKIIGMDLECSGALPKVNISTEHSQRKAPALITKTWDKSLTCVDLTPKKDRDYLVMIQQ